MSLANRHYLDALPLDWRDQPSIKERYDSFRDREADFACPGMGAAKGDMDRLAGQCAPVERRSGRAAPRRGGHGARACGANRVRLLVNGAEAEASARAALGDLAEIVPARYGDIWLRDTGPIFARGRGGAVALRFKTNGWGGKFDLPDDATVGEDIARLAGTPVLSFDFVLEGGAVDRDGEGTILATRQTLLNPNRNGWSKEEAEAALEQGLGAKTVIWIDEGLKNDHTDGHIDNIARFVGPGRVACQSPSGPDDPNAETLDGIARTLEAATDAKGARLEVIRVPEPRALSQRARRDRAGLASQLRHRQWRGGDAGLWHADAR